MGSHFTGSDMSSTLKTLGGYTSFTVSDRCILWKSLFDLVCQQQQQLSTKNQKHFSSLSCQPTLQEQQLTLLLGTFHSRGGFIDCLFVCFSWHADLPGGLPYRQYCCTQATLEAQTSLHFQYLHIPCCVQNEDAGNDHHQYRSPQ
ncbi:hypothetical protein CY35_13G006900 [Sphagnum magellanicum]|nr:hypothetical protein CY35_13G006900 [Sphagnum magellanicum]